MYYIDVREYYIKVTIMDPVGYSIDLKLGERRKDTECL